MEIDETNYLAHYGILRRSGRYPWGSGNTQHERNKGYLSYIDDLLKKGLSLAEIALGMSDEDEKVSTTQLRAAKTIAKAEVKAQNIAMAQRLADKGNSTSAIGRRMNVNESTVRMWLAPGAKEKVDSLTNTSEMLKRQVAEKKFIDVGSGVENQLGMSKERLNASVHMLKEQGYVTHIIKIPQATNNQETRVKVLAAPGTSWGDVRKNYMDIQQINIRTLDNGKSWNKIHDALSINPNRVAVNYASDGGSQADGVIYVRPGVPDVSIGGSNYAQVRIQVGEGHYLKGMALYKDDLPKGVDLVFNTSKDSTGNKLDAMKPLGTDKDFPFGAQIRRQVLADEGLPTEHVTSVMNLVNEEGQWEPWKKNLASQFLSKQSPTLAQAQLLKTQTSRQKELDAIMALTNPTIKKNLLLSFAEGADSSAVNLKAAAVSTRQAYHTILPVNSMKSDEIYAPNFRPGERVALVRYPHGGTFEIPQLTVNNRNPEARNLLGNAQDAVGIHYSVAERLSGADFDGDTVVVIPNNSGKVKSTPALEGLKNFNPRTAYPPYEGMVPMTGPQKQQEMGNVSNLITDMTLRGAPQNDIVRAIRHSMVVIDAEKHNLNWKQSRIDNGIPQLKKEYQHGPDETGRTNAGASTLISKAGSAIRIPDRKPRPASEGGSIDTETGELRYVPSNKTRPGPNGTRVPVMIKTQKLAETTDANTLSSGLPIERLYADHANALKAMANTARLEATRTPPLQWSTSAKKVYEKEVESLNAKLSLAKENRPRERQAQILAKAQIDAKKQDNPGMDAGQLMKVKMQAIAVARTRLEAGKNRNIDITPEEWNAIQAGAISNHKLEEILANTDLEKVRELATPIARTAISSSTLAKANTLLSLGYSKAEVADKLGVSVTRLNTALNEGPGD